MKNCLNCYHTWSGHYYLKSWLIINNTVTYQKSIAILDTLIVKNTHFPQFISRNWKLVCTPLVKFYTYGVHFEFCDGHFQDRALDFKLTKIIEFNIALWHLSWFRFKHVHGMYPIRNVCWWWHQWSFTNSVFWIIWIHCAFVFNHL